MSQLFFQDDYYSIYTSGRNIEYIQMRSEILIVPLTDKRGVILTIQALCCLWRANTDFTRRRPSRMKPTNKPLLANLQEEIGFTAARLDFLGEIRPFSKYFALQSFIYLARELTPSKLEGDEDYPILMERVLLKDFEQLIAEKRLLDGHIIAALYMARSFLETYDK